MANKRRSRNTYVDPIKGHDANLLGHVDEDMDAFRAKSVTYVFDIILLDNLEHDGGETDSNGSFIDEWGERRGIGVGVIAVSDEPDLQTYVPKGQPSVEMIRVFSFKEDNVVSSSERNGSLAHIEAFSCVASKCTIYLYFQGKQA